jgi:anaerobic dimethyl sulfoxide reductase subunit B (iron-sulfur subunit)
MQLGFFFDQQRCTGCQSCQVACQQWNRVPPGPAAWLRVTTVERGSYPDPWLAHLAVSCCHCLEPTCVAACPTSALTKRAEDGLVLVDQELCVAGCRACLHVCPYEAPQFRDDRSRMEKCDFCQDRLAQGREPLCVVSCPLRALEAGPLDELRQSHGGVTEAPGFPDPSRTRPAIVFRPRAVGGREGNA